MDHSQGGARAPLAENSIRRNSKEANGFLMLSFSLSGLYGIRMGQGRRTLSTPGQFPAAPCRAYARNFGIRA